MCLPIIYNLCGQTIKWFLCVCYLAEATNFNRLQAKTAKRRISLPINIFFIWLSVFWIQDLIHQMKLSLHVKLKILYNATALFNDNAGSRNSAFFFVPFGCWCSLAYISTLLSRLWICTWWRFVAFDERAVVRFSS